MTAIDTEWWRSAVDYQRAITRADVRHELALRGAVLLFVGRLDHRKGVPEMLEALTVLSCMSDIPTWSLLCVGSGPLGPQVNRWAVDHPEVPVARTGFVQPAGLPKYYAAADISVLPSLVDPWGFVCLEALVAGLPQVTSSMVGSAPDLVVSRDIGDIADPRDPQSFALCLAARIRQAPIVVPDELRTEAATTWSPTAAATRGLAALRACLET